MPDSEKRIDEQGTQVMRMLMILRYSGLAYSVLQSMGYQQHCPIAVILPRLGMLEELAGKLRIFGLSVLSLNASPKRFFQELVEVHDEVNLVCYTEGRYAADNMETLTELLHCGTMEGMRLEGLIVMAFHQILPAKLCSAFSIILEVSENVLSQWKEGMIETGDKFLKDHILQHYSILNHELNLQTKPKAAERDREFWDTIPLLLALAFQNRENPRESAMKIAFDKALSWAYEKTDFYGVDKQMEKLFRESLDALTPAVCKFWPEERVEELSDKDWKDWILYDEKFYYLPEKIFGAVCHPFHQYFSEKQIKQVLADGGLISTEGKNRMYFTKKKPLESASGRIARYVWFNREKLEGGCMDSSFAKLFQLRRNA